MLITPPLVTKQSPISHSPPLSPVICPLSLSLSLPLSLSRLNTHITCLMSCREREERECMCNQVSSKERSGFATNPQLGNPPNPPPLSYLLLLGSLYLFLHFPAPFLSFLFSLLFSSLLFHFLLSPFAWFTTDFSPSTAISSPFRFISPCACSPFCFNQWPCTSGFSPFSCFVSTFCNVFLNWVFSFFSKYSHFIVKKT